MMTGNNRRDQLKALFGTVESIPAPEPKPAEPQSAPNIASEAQKPRAASGAVKAMGLSLGGMSREIEDARRLKESLEGVERVVELDPGLVETSFVEDRLSHAAGLDEDFENLVESIKQNGQQVPVLVRPHPERPGHYQTAYGHRRLRAAQRIGKPVQAIVRELSDVQLVLAQGKENTERRDLSFIERAFFARNLVERGFERGLVQDALSIDKAEMTRFLQVAAAVPYPIVRAIGPAPKIGRPRWVRFAELLKSGEAQAIALNEVTLEPFSTADSNTRFNRIFERLLKRVEPVALPTRNTMPAVDRKIADTGAIARLNSDGARQVLTFADHISQGFAAFVADELEALLARYNSRTSDK
ncbi:plasmid partitioning protein RepB [Phyllobacterium sp. YR531]|uniref:plasmid partitioning protein RepB n=1 Tax=Phyllobacterium sp. YR531 TaxID=1144343 RepID=UPI00026FBB27|nr:plasmid partitioning protein RepB [Phyllobacterium sp. YR531]EJN02320.1 plasmid partitioning protein RepB [Phyllobacterium sp. YR531]